MLSSTVDPEEARRTAREILSGAEYSEPEESLLERAVGWITDRLGDAVATLTGGGPGSVIGWIVVIGLVAGATWLLVRTLGVPAVPSGHLGDDALRYGTESHRDAQAWLREAERLGLAGDHRGALRCRYQALLARLIAEGVVDDVPGRTPGEYRALLEDRLPGERRLVGDVTRSFEAAWYGGRAVDRAEAQHFSKDCRRVESATEHAMADA